MQYTIEQLRKHFAENPLGCLTEVHREEVRSPEFQKKFVRPSHYDALESLINEKDSFLRLHGLSDAAHRALHSRERLVRHGTNYFLWQNHLVEKNLGLVYGMANNVHGLVDKDVALSEGMARLSRAVELFDPWRGFKFSTYACRAIIKSLGRVRRKEARRHSLFPASLDEGLVREEAERTSGDSQVLAERLSLLVYSGVLSSSEVEIIHARFPVKNGGKRRTFQDIGDKIGLSKERVRQLQNAALEKLREAFLEENPKRYRLGTNVVSYLA